VVTETSTAVFGNRQDQMAIGKGGPQAALFAAFDEAGSSVKLRSVAFLLTPAKRHNSVKAGNGREAQMAHKFEIYKDKAGEFRVRFMYNSEVMFSTQGYSSKSSAVNAIESIKKNGPGAPTVEAEG
jgi:hypothetical protein